MLWLVKIQCTVQQFVKSLSQSGSGVTMRRNFNDTAARLFVMGDQSMTWCSRLTMSMTLPQKRSGCKDVRFALMIC